MFEAFVVLYGQLFVVFHGGGAGCVGTHNLVVVVRHSRLNARLLVNDIIQAVTYGAAYNSLFLSRIEHAVEQELIPPIPQNRMATSSRLRYFFKFLYYCNTFVLFLHLHVNLVILSVFEGDT